MKKVLLLTLLISTLSYGKMITVKEKPKENVIHEKVYDFSQSNSNFLNIKSSDGNVYIINKKYITSIQILDDKVYIVFIDYNYGCACESIRVHQDSYDVVYNFLNEK